MPKAARGAGPNRRAALRSGGRAAADARAARVAAHPPRTIVYKLRMRGILGAAAGLWLVGCGHAAPPPAQEPTPTCKPPDVSLVLAATDKVNPAEDGRGRPVQVRVYLLKSDARLQSAKFEDIWQNQAAVLADDLMKTEEFTLFPSATKSVTLAPNLDARNVAVVALFREPQGKHWFISYDLEAPRAEKPCRTERAISVSLDRMQVEDGQGSLSDPDSKGK